MTEIDTRATDVLLHWTDLPIKTSALTRLMRWTLTESRHTESNLMVFVTYFVISIEPDDQKQFLALKTFVSIRQYCNEICAHGTQRKRYLCRIFVLSSDYFLTCIACNTDSSEREPGKPGANIPVNRDEIKHAALEKQHLRIQQGRLLLKGNQRHTTSCLLTRVEFITLLSRNKSFTLGKTYCGCWPRKMWKKTEENKWSQAILLALLQPFSLKCLDTEDFLKMW